MYHWNQCENAKPCIYTKPLQYTYAIIVFFFSIAYTCMSSVQHVRSTETIYIGDYVLLSACQCAWDSVALLQRYTCMLVRYVCACTLVHIYYQRVKRVAVCSLVSSSSSSSNENHASNKTDSVRVVNGRDVTNQIKFSRVAHRQFDGTWLAFQCNHASNVINEVAAKVNGHVHNGRWIFRCACCCCCCFYCLLLSLLLLLDFVS